MYKKHLNMENEYGVLANLETVEKQPPPSITPTVFIVDDDQAMRESLVELVHAMKFAARSFDSAEAFLESFDPNWMGCIILDVHMPGMSGIELHDHLISLGALTPVIIITGHGDVSMCADSMKKGAVDFLEKPYRPLELRTKIADAMELAVQIEGRQQKEQEIQSRFESLNSEELGILKDIALGKRNKDIASERDISLRTVQLRRNSILEKLGVENRVELIRLAVSYLEEF